MMRKLLPLLLILLGAGAGVGAGFFLRPPPAAAVGDEHGADPAPQTANEAAKSDQLPEFVKLTNQFIVPVVEKNRIVSLVILSLSLEVKPGGTERVFAQEPKLRDGILQLLFDHANTGGFRGSFTDADNLVILRRGLKEVAQRVLGDMVKDVLITDMIRQDS
ncbi:flagellar basal body-associated protein FliL [Pseudotabrizicola alkalilacus]|uniref:Flagellar protein FliL n=2 Tax=Pseudotabrizicola alkalilacus TaxID=2305252 RepID=A0A411YX93_9RHOB|nr:flagellar basal body-associated protein FliL [Pseudotabrizicola alkalilacus]